MNVRTYRASTMREALDMVRRELGRDAIILSTRQHPLKRRFPWQRVRYQAEIVAGLAEQTAPLRSTAESLNRPPASPIPSADPLAERTDERPFPMQASARAAVVPQEWQRRSFAHHTLSPRPPSAPTIENLLHELHTGATSRTRTEIPDHLFQLYMRLIDADVDEQDARELVFEFQQQSIDVVHDPRRAAAALVEIVERHVRSMGPIQVTPGKRTVAALVGPTGVGKTTTVAKLAANFKLRDRIQVGLITVDTYRVAAVEQLRTYAEIIDLPMHVVGSPREMRRAVDDLSGVDLVLIDTAGRSPRDELKIQELRSFLAEADVDQVHLVLSLVSSARSLQQAAEKFRLLGTTALLLTKLDEAAGAGAILTAARRIQLPISYITTGQDVPDDIEPASTPQLTRLILGPECPFVPPGDGER